MSAYPIWSLTLILAALAGTITLLVLARLQRWERPSAAAPQPEVQIEAESAPSAGDFKSRLVLFLRAHPWELLLSAVLLAVAAYLTVFAPVQMMGKVSIQPLEAGRPFFFLHWQRNGLGTYYYETATAFNLICGLLSLTLMSMAWKRRSLQQLHTALLWGSLSLAGAAQWYLCRELDLRLGIGMYLAAAAGFFYWARQTRKQVAADTHQPVRVSRGLEITLIVAVVALAAFGRLFELRTIPYGIEGDESKWTGEVVSLGLRGLPDLSGLYHRDALPTSFYMQTPFHKILGPSLFAARLEVALFSILATFLFYLLIRRIANIPLALLAAWLLSVSIFDISASRLANVESHVAVWPVMTLMLLAWAIPTKRWQAYAISGIALVLGLLTYDTVWPLLVVAFVLAVLEVSQQEADLSDKVQCVAALLAPSVLALPILLPYFASRVSYYGFGTKGWEAGLATLWVHFTEVLDSWFIHVYPDFLYNRAGPLLNAFVLPWMVLGLVIAVATIRQRYSTWFLLWFALFILPTPIAAHSPFGRVYYPGLPAAYALAALGLYLFVRDSLRAIPSSFHSVIKVLALCVLIWLPLINWYIYFNEVSELHDRQVRREIGEIAGEAAGMDTLIVLPSIPRADEPLNNEFPMIELFMLDKIPSDQIYESYTYVELDKLLPALPYGLTNRPNLEIILDKDTAAERAQRDELAAALKRCYPKGKLTEGNFFDRYSLSAEALAEPACTAASLTLEAVSQEQLTWSLSKSNATDLSLQCSIQNVEHLWVEAETIPPPPGWQGENAFATGWTGEGFLADNYNSLPILFNFDETTANSVYLWLRAYKRVPDDTSVVLDLNGESASVAAQVTVNEWHWERVGPFPVHAGINTLSISRPYTGDPYIFMAVFIDVLVITPDENFQPDQDYYLPLPPRQFHLTGKQSQGAIPLNLEPGTYHCYIEARNGQNLVDAFGHAPLQSNTVTLEIKP